MRTMFTLCLVGFFICGYSQTKPAPKQLYYFYSKDSLVGVRDAKGKVVIEPSFTSAYGDAFQSPIETRFISLINDKNPGEPGLQTRVSYYDHNGQFLFHPYWFDNGPDFYNDGLMRFVEEGKFGFADRDGNKTIAAAYDYAEAFRYGMSFVCNGCRFQPDSINPEVVELTNGSWGLINTKGEVLIEPGKITLEQVNRVTDSLISLSRGEAPALEKDILARMEAVPGIKRLISIPWQEAAFSKITFHISEKPTTGFPYYRIKAYGHDRTDVTELEQFLASKDGKQLYSNSVSLSGKPEPIAAWVEEMKQQEKLSRKNR